MSNQDWTKALLEEVNRNVDGVKNVAIYKTIQQKIKDHLSIYSNSTLESLGITWVNKTPEFLGIIYDGNKFTLDYSLYNQCPSEEAAGPLMSLMLQKPPAPHESDYKKDYTELSLFITQCHYWNYPGISGCKTQAAEDLPEFLEEVTKRSPAIVTKAIYSLTR